MGFRLLMRLYVCLCIVQIKQFWIWKLNLNYMQNYFASDTICHFCNCIFPGNSTTLHQATDECWRICCCDMQCVCGSTGAISAAIGLQVFLANVGILGSRPLDSTVSWTQHKERYAAEELCIVSSQPKIMYLMPNLLRKEVGLMITVKYWYTSIPLKIAEIMKTLLLCTHAESNTRWLPNDSIMCNCNLIDTRHEFYVSIYGMVKRHCTIL